MGHSAHDCGRTAAEQAAGSTRATDRPTSSTPQPACLLALPLNLSSPPPGIETGWADEETAQEVAGMPCDACNRRRCGAGETEGFVAGLHEGHVGDLCVSNRAVCVPCGLPASASASPPDSSSLSSIRRVPPKPGGLASHDLSTRSARPAAAPAHRSHAARESSRGGLIHRSSVSQRLLLHASRLLTPPPMPSPHSPQHAYHAASVSLLLAPG